MNFKKGRRFDGWLLPTLMTGRTLPALMASVMVTSATAALAQNVTLDGSLGPAQPLAGPAYVIPQAVGQTSQNRLNLFHSFGQFNLNLNESALFETDADVRTIFARVTGGASTIDGPISTQRPNVNLFLLNSSGILFGPNAQLNVGGSFVASTANALQFGDQGRFDALPTVGENPALLTINPSAFLFNQLAAAPIVVNARRQVGTNPFVNEPLFEGLRVPNGNSLLLLGGDVRLENGVLQAPAGRVELGGLSTSGTVQLSTNGSEFRLTFPTESIRSDVTMTQGAQVDVRSAGGGSIGITARDIFISTPNAARLIRFVNRPLSLAAGFLPGSGSLDAQAGDIQLNATGAITLDPGTIFNVVPQGSSGNGGDVVVQAGSLSLLNNSGILTNIDGPGSQGDVTIDVVNGILFSGRDSGIISNVFEFADDATGGNISVRAATLRLTDRAQITGRTFGGDAGNLTVDVGSLTLEQGGRFVADTFSDSGGDAGDITITVQNDASFSGRSGNAQSGISSSVQEGAIDGNAGRIQLTVGGSLSLSDRALISARTNGQGNAGPIDIKVDGAVNLSRSNIDSQIEADGVGNGGNITLTADSLTLVQNAGISTIINDDNNDNNSARGNAGDITIAVNGTITLSGRDTVIDTSVYDLGTGGDVSIRAGGAMTLSNRAQLRGRTFGGDAGNMTVDVGSLTLTGGARFVEDTFTNRPTGGDAGDITIFSRGDIFLSGSSGDSLSGISSDATSGAIGEAGNITITTQGSLFLENAARISVGTNGTGDAGDITIRADGAISVVGGYLSEAGDRSGIFSDVGRRSPGQGGEIAIVADSVSVSNGGRISASTEGIGNAGNIQINASEFVRLFRNEDLPATQPPDASSIAVPFGTGIQTDTVLSDSLVGLGGRGGDITVTTPTLQISDGAVISSSTRNVAQQGGNIELNVETLDVERGGQVFTTTFGSGDAGRITVNAESVTLAGSDLSYTDRLAALPTQEEQPGFFNWQRGLPTSATSGLFADTGTSSAGTGGSITVNTGGLRIADGAELSAQSRGNGDAGSLEVDASTIALDTQGRITTETTSEDGGNIDIQTDILLLRRGSQISTSAGTDLTGGNGGNITITAPFLVAVLSENSDITANAFVGNGGNVEITAQGIFGIQFRPQLTPESDITASSTFGISGTVVLNTPDLDPSRGLVVLPTNLADPSSQIAQGCTPSDGQSGGTFVATGRGGLPPSPNQPLTNEAVLSPWVSLEPAVSSEATRIQPNHTTDRRRSSAEIPAEGAAIVEAQGWTTDRTGIIVLTAHAPTHPRFLSPSASCHAP